VGGSISLAFTIVRLLVPMLGIRCATLGSEKLRRGALNQALVGDEGFRRLKAITPCGWFSKSFFFLLEFRFVVGTAQYQR
jgi:hypothetical protein